MNKPTDLEVNKKLSEYMEVCSSYDDAGYCTMCKRSKHCCKPTTYTESFDAQITIMEKFELTSNFNSMEKFQCIVNLIWEYELEDMKMEKASAYALYYAILEDGK